MDALTEVNGAPDFSVEFFAALQLQAELDADGVGQLFRDAELLPQSGMNNCNPALFSIDVLLGIGLAVRFKRWEINHIRVHIDSGLPSSSGVFERIIELNGSPELGDFVRLASSRALGVYHDSFVWARNDCNLQVDMAIVSQADEQFLDAVAEFLFQQVQ